MTLTEEELDVLRSMFDLARLGDTARLAGAIDAGVPVNLTNAAGDSLLMLAAYHDHPDTVCALLDRGADTARVNDRGQTALGPRSALDVARFFDLPEMQALLRGARPVRPCSTHTGAGMPQR